MSMPRVIGLVTENSPDFVLQSLQIWDEGAIVLPLRSADDAQRIAQAHANEVRQPGKSGGWLRHALTPRSDEAPAQLLFTSGTEGEPKGIWLSHKNLADSVQRLNQTMQVTAEIREYIGVPVYHSFGFGRCRAIMAAGGHAYIPERGFNPIEINTMLEAGEINAISAVPSLWRLLLQSKPLSAKAAGNVRWIEIGSQFMSADEKRTLRDLFPNAAIVQHYGLTEASRTTFLEIHKASNEQLASVGKPLGAVEVRIRDDGRIQVRGPHVTVMMLVNGQLADPRDADGWLTTNDQGHLEDGYLTYIGRADDVINCGGIKLAPDDLEHYLAVQGGLTGDYAICRVPDAVRGDGILLAASTALDTDDATLKQLLISATQHFGVNARDASHVFRVAQLERTQNGKVRRQAIAQQFIESQAAPGAINAATTPGHAEKHNLRGRLSAILGVTTIADTDNFVNLGGDSLRYIQACVALEEALGYLPENWEVLPFAQLESMVPKKTRSSQIEPSVLLRALAIISVVVNHAGVFKDYFAIDGAAFMLLLPAGYSFARFQLQRVIESAKGWLAMATLPRLIVPTVLVVGLQQLRHHEIQPTALLLIENYFNRPDIFHLWFIEVFVQTHIILALLLCIAPVRQALRRTPWAASIVALLASAAISALVPLVWNTDYLFNLVPHKVLWYFFTGWCILFAQKTWQRWVNSACVVAIAILLSDGHGLPGSESLWILLGGLFLNWAPVMRMPTPVVRGISAVASASLYIYVSHFLTIDPVGKIFPRGGTIGESVGAIVIGIGFWLVFERAWQLAWRLAGRIRPKLRAVRGA